MDTSEIRCQICTAEIGENCKNLPGQCGIPQRQHFDDVPALPALETQIGGSHYKDMAIQPMTYSMANGLDACQHTIVKYVSRFRQKNGIEDLEKAKHCIDLLIEFEKAKL